MKGFFKSCDWFENRRVVIFFEVLDFNVVTSQPVLFCFLLGSLRDIWMLRVELFEKLRKMCPSLPLVLLPVSIQIVPINTTCTT